jgi:3-oxoacyl-[acyl-carrier protein] reductase
MGRKGATAKLLYVAEGADEHLAGPERIFLSKRSAFVTGQPIEVMTGLDAPDVSWHQPLAGQVALVTGAARGIGAATARRLAAEGAQVVCLDRPADERLLQAVVDEIKGFSLALDVTDDKTPEAMVSFLQQRFGGVDVVIHNAGITRDKTLARMKPSWWDVTMDVNLNAIMKMQRALESSGCLRDGGRVVCLSSIAGIAGNVGQTNYAASKSGLAGYVRHRAPDLLDRQIAISAVAPGFIETRLTEAIPFVTREGARRLSSLGQGGLPEDVAELLTFLATPAAMGLSGNVIRICGGNLVGA